MKAVTVIGNSAFSLLNFRGHLIADLVKSGCRVHALAPDYSGNDRKRMERMGAVPVDYYMDRNSINVAKEMRSVYSLIKALRKINPDINFSYGIKPNVYSLYAARKANINSRHAMVCGLGRLYPARHDTSLSARFKRAFANLMYRVALPHADTVFFQNPDDKRLFEEKRIVFSEKTRLVNGSGVDLDFYQTTHFQQQPVTFTLVSRIIEEKGIYEFVEAAHRIADQYPGKEIRFNIVGNAKLNPYSVVESELNNGSRNGTVTWLGFVDDVRACLEQTSVFVLPTYYREGIPKSILEAMAMARPVITTNMPGCRETVREGVNGFLVEPMNVDDLTIGMQRFLDDPSLIERFGWESRKMAEEKYDVKDINQLMMENMGLQRRNGAK